MSESAVLEPQKGNQQRRVKLKFHWHQFPRNFSVANVTGKLPTSYEEVGDVANKSARKLRGNWSLWNLSFVPSVRRHIRRGFVNMGTVHSLVWAPCPWSYDFVIIIIIIIMNEYD